MDAARLLPVVGFVVLMLPVLLGESSTRNLTVFIFVIWVILIVVAAVISRVLGAELAPPQDSPDKT